MFVHLVSVELIVNIVKECCRRFRLNSIGCNLDITGCVFPFVDNQNQTHNTCITTSDFFGGTIPGCRNALGQARSCQSKRQGFVEEIH